MISCSDNDLYGSRKRCLSHTISIKTAVVTYDLSVQVLLNQNNMKLSCILSDSYLLGDVWLNINLTTLVYRMRKYIGTTIIACARFAKSRGIRLFEHSILDQYFSWINLRYDIRINLEIPVLDVAAHGREQ